MIRLANVTTRVGTFRLEEVTLDVPTGGYGLVIGPTGSGKTTLLETIAGHVPLEAGQVELDGAGVGHLPPERRGVGMVYQHYHLFPHMTVAENIAYGLARTPTGERQARVAELATILGIEGLLDRGTQHLSGGEQQRVALARALAPRPRVLLLDEPFAALDPSTRRTLRRELRALHAREGATILQVTHDFSEALRLGDRVVVLARGRVIQAGLPEVVFRRPNSAFVAQFIGSGNVLAGTLHLQDRPAHAGALAAARFTSDGLELDVLASHEGASHAVIRPEDLTLSVAPGATSARNHFPARVVTLEREGPLTWVHLDAGASLVAALTTSSAEALRLAPGVSVTVAIKATAILLV